MVRQVWDAHVFHYIVENGVTYLCMADEQSRRRVPFAFLEVMSGITVVLQYYSIVVVDGVDVVDVDVDVCRQEAHYFL